MLATPAGFRKVDVRLPGKGNSNSHGARPVHLISTMIKWIRTSRLSIKKTRSATAAGRGVGFYIWEGYRESRRCLSDTYPESYITKYTSIRRLLAIIEGHGDAHEVCFSVSKSCSTYRDTSLIRKAPPS